MGHYSSVRHELLLLGIKGSYPIQVKKLFGSVVIIKRTRHSEKPPYFRELIDRLYPNGKRIELFSRGDIPSHWDKWGNE
jgi:N6-adenosine-specific RNA methylase IME4